MTQSIRILISLLSLLAFSWTGLAHAFEPLPEKPPIPNDNKMTPDKIKLGKQLYFDPRLSKNNKVSCNSCHDVTQGKGGVDNLQFSKGINDQLGGRNAPTVWNAAFLSTQFWDGREPSLEEQAKGPMINPVEMGNENHKVVIEKLKKIPGYVAQFNKVFAGKDPVNIDNAAKAIAAYERTLITPNSPFDRYIKGDKKAMSAKAQAGMKLFTSVGCVSCHSGANFAGPKLPEGQGFFMKFPTFANTEYDKKYKFSEDLGRYTATKKDSDKNMWRVPSLRNIELTAPYFHNGKVKKLDEAVRVMAKTQLNKDLKPQEVENLVAFLKALTGELPKQTPPKLPK